MRLEERKILRPYDTVPGRRKTWLAEEVLGIVAEDQMGG
jgi:hypothetical protein